MVNLGLALTCPKELFEATKILGTKPFMAIDALKGEHHSLLQDLKSFF